MRVLVDGEGRRKFASVDELQAALPEEVLYRLYEAMNEGCWNAGTPRFLPTPYFQRLNNYARRYGVTLSAAMAKDDYLVEAAGWARYYERTREIITDAKAAGIAGEPPREVIDNPDALRQWVERCERAYMART